jgi:hypothetical protein
MDTLHRLSLRHQSCPSRKATFRLRRHRRRNSRRRRSSVILHARFPQGVLRKFGTEVLWQIHLVGRRSLCLFFNYTLRRNSRTVIVQRVCNCENAKPR